MSNEERTAELRALSAAFALPMRDLIGSGQEMTESSRSVDYTSIPVDLVREALELVMAYNGAVRQGKSLRTDTLKASLEYMLLAVLANYEREKRAEPKECRSPYCECEVGKCKEGKVDKRGS